MDATDTYCYICGARQADKSTLISTSLIKHLEYILEVSLSSSSLVMTAYLACLSCNQKLQKIEELISEIKKTHRSFSIDSEQSITETSEVKIKQEEEEEEEEEDGGQHEDNVVDPCENIETDTNNGGMGDGYNHAHNSEYNDKCVSIDGRAEQFTKKRLSYTCGCGEACHTIRALELHRRERHGGGVVCKDCGVTLMTPKDLNQHSFVHRKDAYNCGICGIGFRKELYLQNHQRMSKECSKAVQFDVADLDIKTLRACGCGEKFPSTEALKKHRILKHLGKFLCSECSSTFGTIGSLRRHMYFHKGGKFECQECGKSFKHPAYLQTHQRRFHSLRQDSATDASKPLIKRKTRAAKLTPSLRKLRRNPARGKRDLSKNKTVVNKDVIVEQRTPEMTDADEQTQEEGRMQLTEEDMEVKEEEDTIRQRSNSRSENDEPDICDEIKGQTPEVPKIACAVCDVTYQTEASLTKHITSYHWESSAGNSLTCIVCSQTFKEMSTMADHARSHRVEMHHKCKKCDFVFVKKEHLMEHGFLHHTDSNQPPQAPSLKCQFCPEEAPSQSLLSLHCLTQHGKHASLGLVSPRERPHECSFCPMSFASRRDLQKHLAKHARALRDKTAFLYSCTECLKKCKTQAGLEKHEKQFCPGKNGVFEDEMGNVRRSFVCELCGAFYKTRSSYELHLSKHTGEGKHECEICQQKFRMKAHLTKHLAGHNRPFMCAECGKQFSTSNHLKEHQAIHTTDLNHVCSVCEEKFRWRLSLVRHQWRKHNMGSAPKTYRKLVQCKICEAEVSRNGRMDHFNKEHKDVSYSPKQFRCLECKTSSSRRNNPITTSSSSSPQHHTTELHQLDNPSQHPSTNTTATLHDQQRLTSPSDDTAFPHFIMQTNNEVNTSSQQTSKPQLNIHSPLIIEPSGPNPEITIEVRDVQSGPAAVHKPEEEQHQLHQLQNISNVCQGPVSSPPQSIAGIPHPETVLPHRLPILSSSFPPRNVVLHQIHGDILSPIHPTLSAPASVELSVPQLSHTPDSPMTDQHGASPHNISVSGLTGHQEQYQTLHTQNLHQMSTVSSSKFSNGVTVSSAMSPYGGIQTQLNVQTEAVEQIFPGSFGNFPGSRGEIL